MQKNILLNQPVSIISIASVSPLGNSLDQAWESYLVQQPLFSSFDLSGNSVPVAFIHPDCKTAIEQIRESDPKYRTLDNSVLYAIAASRKAAELAGWTSVFGINIGSSRGATSLFEKYHAEFLAAGKSAVLSSPTTTLGNISSWVAHDLQSDGPEISHSITCSTALHALLNGMAWLRAGMAERFLVGGSEAPLTAFTIAQMQALKIYGSHREEFPCRAMDFNKRQNSMILGEGSSVCCITAGKTENALAIVEGVGYATEILQHPISISIEAECFKKSMKMALGETDPESIDVVVMHAPGTIAGDRSELKAIESVFGTDLPMLTTNKWQIGHTFGASGMLSIEMAVLMLKHQQFLPVPFAAKQTGRNQIRKILVNSVGFGGNAVSILLSKD